MAVDLRVPGGVGVSPGVSSTTCVIAKPTNLAVGDLMKAHVLFQDTTPLDSAPTGWAFIRGDNYNIFRSELWWKIADSDDVAASNFTFTLAESCNNLGTITAWTGHDPTTPINAHNGGSGYGTTVTAPTITPLVANCMICMICSCRYILKTFGNYAVATDNPASWSEAYDRSGAALSMALGYAIRPETSATGNGTASVSSTAFYIGQLVAIAPVPVVAPTVTTQDATGIGFD